MPPQGATLLRPAAVPGAINLTAATLAWGDILSIATGGPTSAQTTLSALAEFLGIVPFGYQSRVVVSNTGTTILPTDVAVLVNKTIAGATNFLLPDPILADYGDGTFQARVLIFKDMKGDSGTNAITLDAGAGNLINGLQTLVMNANWSTTMLIGMSDSQWGTLI